MGQIPLSASLCKIRHCIRTEIKPDNTVQGENPSDTCTAGNPNFSYYKPSQVLACPHMPITELFLLSKVSNSKAASQRMQFLGLGERTHSLYDSWEWRSQLGEKWTCCVQAPGVCGQGPPAASSSATSTNAVCVFAKEPILMSTLWRTLGGWVCPCVPTVCSSD